MVRESQEATLVHEGQFADTFVPGTHSLTTRNMPIMADLRGWKYGFESPFKSEVYFTNIRLFNDLGWGTANPIIMRDADFGMLRIRAFGIYSIRVKDSKKFLKELVGTNGLYTRDDITEQLRKSLISRFTDTLGEAKIPALDLAAHYDELSDLLRTKMDPEFQTMGLECSKLFIENISLPPEVEAMMDKRTSVGMMAPVMGAYTQMQVADSLPLAAQNPGGAAGIGMGLGAGMGLGSVMGQQMGGALGQMSQAPYPQGRGRAPAGGPRPRGSQGPQGGTHRAQGPVRQPAHHPGRIRQAARRGAVPARDGLRAPGWSLSVQVIIGDPGFPQGVVMSLLVVGSVAFDDLETPSGRRVNILGGSASYFALAASRLHPVQVVAVVGEDFGPDQYRTFQGRPIDLAGLVRKSGRSFHWRGEYGLDLNEATTLETQLNVFADFHPVLPDAYRTSSCLFLGNIDPALQLDVVRQMATRPRWIGLDTMNFWINGAREGLERVLREVDVLLINEAEARSLTAERHLLAIYEKIQAKGPRILVVKRGEYGVALFTPEGCFLLPAFPLKGVTDPTGAGDTFAGGFMGYLASTPNTDLETLKRAHLDGNRPGQLHSRTVRHRRAGVPVRQRPPRPTGGHAQPDPCGLNGIEFQAGSLHPGRSVRSRFALRNESDRVRRLIQGRKRLGFIPMSTHIVPVGIL